MKRQLFALTTATLLASGAAFAAAGMSAVPIGSHGFVTVQQNDRSEDRSANINERESEIRNRIDRGISDGRITRQEAHRLYDELSQIEARERAPAATDASADGRAGRSTTTSTVLRRTFDTRCATISYARINGATINAATDRRLFAFSYCPLLHESPPGDSRGRAANAVRPRPLRATR